MKTNCRLTSFATYRDLRGYIECRDGGGSSSFCLNKGDNGKGAWGDNTATTKVAMCALPVAEMVKKWGTSAAARGKKVKVTMGSKTVVCELRDKGPAGVCDLNPGALIAFGLDQETELNVKGSWTWA